MRKNEINLIIYVHFLFVFSLTKKTAAGHLIDTPIKEITIGIEEKEIGTERGDEKRTEEGE